MFWLIPIAKRVLSAVLSVVLLSFLLFWVLDSAPGNYVELKRSAFPINQQGNEAFLKWEQNFKAEHPIDAPTLERTQIFLIGLVKGNVGFSYQDPDQPILQLVGEKLSTSLILVFCSLSIAMGIGIPLGILAARYKNTALDYSLMSSATLGLAIPPYVVAVVLILFFSVFCRRFMLGDFFPLQWLALPSGGWGELRHLFLPSIVLSLAPLAAIARYCRSFVLEVLDEPYIITARAKGLSTSRIYQSYLLRPSLSKLMSILGNQLSIILVGAVFVEQIFRIPGLGQLFISAAAQRDTPLLISVTLALVLVVMGFHIFIDLILMKLDPRVRID